MGVPMLWRTRATSRQELLQRRQQRLEVLVGSAGAPATSVRRAAALFSSCPTCRHWHCQNCSRFWVCDKALCFQESCSHTPAGSGFASMVRRAQGGNGHWELHPWAWWDRAEGKGCLGLWKHGPGV